MTAIKAAPRRTLFDALATLANEARDNGKTAAAKRSDEVSTGAPTGEKDPGGYQGESTHPTADADNETQPAKDGARAKENEADVKEDVKPSVDAASKVPVDSDVQEKDQLQIGLTQSGPGNDPSVEDDYKDRLPDPGTEHPAKADIGEKYSSCTFKEAHAHVVDLSNDILADLANGFGGRLEEVEKRAAAAPKAPAVPLATKLALATTAVKTGQSPKTAAAAPVAGRSAPAAPPEAAVPPMSKEASDALQAGYELASLLGVEKTAMDDGARATLDAAINDGLFDADLVGNFYKRALSPVDEAGGGEAHEAPEDTESGAGPANSGGGAPPPDMMAEGGGGAPGGMPGGDPSGGGGGPPPDPTAMGPGGSGPLSPMGPGGDAGGGAGGGGEEQALQELAMALEELGIPLDRLAQMSSSAGSGMPPGEPAKVANAVAVFRQSGRFQFKQAATVQEWQLRNDFKHRIRHLLGWV